MSRRLCPTCGVPMELKHIGRRPCIPVAYCVACDVVVDPRFPDGPVDFFRCSADRNEKETVK